MARKMLRTVRAGLRSLHRDEQGADMLEYILIVAAIALPLLALVLIFRNDIYNYATQKWQDITGSADTTT